jgi:hypothetical protein
MKTGFGRGIADFPAIFSRPEGGDFVFFSLRVGEYYIKLNIIEGVGIGFGGLKCNFNRAILPSKKHRNRLLIII